MAANEKERGSYFTFSVHGILTTAEMHVVSSWALG